MNNNKHAYKPKHANVESLDKFDSELIYIHIINNLVRIIYDLV